MEARDYSKEGLQTFIDQQVQKARSNTEETNERREKIENLKTMIRAGLYDVPSELIAEKLAVVLSRKVRIRLV